MQLNKELMQMLRKFQIEMFKMKNIRGEPRPMYLSRKDQNKIIALRNFNLISFDEHESLDETESSNESIKLFSPKIKDNGNILLTKSRLESKKWNNEHDQILYGFMKKLEEEYEKFCFSDFDLGNKRPDILAINKDFQNKGLNPVIYEIKHSKEDFYSDVKNPEKRKTYLDYCTKLYYVCRDGVIKEEDVPSETGLIYVNNDQSFVIIKEPTVTLENQESIVSHEKIKELLLTLIVRSIPSNFQMQIAKTEKDLFEIKETQKYTSRSYKNSFIFSYEHKFLLSKIEDREFNISPLRYVHLEDLIAWDLIYRDENGVNKITNKGRQLLETYKKQKSMIDSEIPDYFDKEKNMILLGEDLSYNVDYIVLPISKKPKNINIKHYVKIENFLAEHNYIQKHAHQYFLIASNEDKKDLKEEFCQEMGVVKIIKNSLGENRGLSIEKRAKKHTVSEDELVYVLKLILMKFIQERKHLLFF